MADNRLWSVHKVLFVDHIRIEELLGTTMPLEEAMHLARQHSPNGEGIIVRELGRRAQWTS